MSADPASGSDLLGAYPFLVRPAATMRGGHGTDRQPDAGTDTPFDFNAPPPPPMASHTGSGAGSRARSVDAPYDYAAAEARGDERPADEKPADEAPAPVATAVAWSQARRIALRAGSAPLAPVLLPLADALGSTLSAPLEALTDLPAFDTSAMDGWAVSGPGPWRVRGQILAGHTPAAGAAAQLTDGTAARIATGAQLPPGATAVLRSEDGRVRRDRTGAELLHDQGAIPLDVGRDIRPRGQECRTGEPLLPPGTAVTAAVLGLAAAAGCDRLAVHRRPTVELLILGDELLDGGLPRDGRIRDALGPLLPSWLSAYGARVDAVRRVHDDLGLLRDALLRSPADVIVTTGGTAAGPVDHLHRALADIGATLLVDGVQVRPGHPMLLASLPSPGPRPESVAGGAPSRRHLVGLPGNPLAAVAGAVTLAEPLLRALAGSPPSEPYRARAAVALPGHPEDTRLLPVVLPDRGAVPLAFDGPAMLRGLALAEGFAVVPPGGVRAGGLVEVLELLTGTAS